MAEEFSYKLIEKSPVTIVTFQGRMNKSSRESLLKCHEDLEKLQGGNVMLYFKDVQSVDHIIFRELIILQTELRKKGVTISIVGLSLSLKQFLIEKGVIRLSEFKSTLEEAFKCLG